MPLYRPTAKQCPCKERPLLGNARNIHARKEWRSLCGPRRDRCYTRLDGNRGAVSSAWSMPMSYLEDNWRYNSVDTWQEFCTGLGHGSRETATVIVRYQATTNEGCNKTENKERVIQWFVMCSNELYKCAINPIINPKPVYSHVWQYAVRLWCNECRTTAKKYDRIFIL
jgi:hypothetical protein